MAEPKDIEPEQTPSPPVREIVSTPNKNEPTEQELATLRKVAGKLPWSAFLVAIVELCERFAYYGLNGPFQNYMQHKYKEPSGVPGAIGLGQSTATGLSSFFQVWITRLTSRKLYVVRPPKGSIYLRAFKVMYIGMKNGGKLDAAKSSYQRHNGGRVFPWDDQFVDEMKRALVACRVFIYFPIYWVCYQQMVNNFVSQAATMQLHGIPNDIMQNINPLAIIIFIPICDRIVYPLLRKRGIKFKPITRITTGFLFASIAMAYAAIVQHLIYSSPPCYNAPMKCDASKDGKLPNQVHVAIQSPAYLMIGLSEIFASITGLEYAYTKAPPSMKSFVMAMFLLTSAFGAALGMAISPVAKDPKLVWMYTGLSVASAVAGLIFWILFSRYNAKEEDMNALADKELREDRPVAAKQNSII
ncbi:MFS peptide transporter Ptr2 [Trichophyton equinum CBS 127.97]|uniref:MFS peptide transporter Ptr2 n=1 Tax=Trichophyton equinum (strain ATCC MYA-4606 / CBS 127.97) TaxID=559882 RepID=F2PPJ7_TRIEC|nr:MFS peptide transporter Ptr2 [Trichophyton equinum CBS 127.97]